MLGHVAPKEKPSRIGRNARNVTIPSHFGQAAAAIVL